MAAEGLAAMALGLGLGFSLAGPPGPVNALIAREAVRGGAWAGIRVGYPAPLLDTLALLLVFFGLPHLVDVSRWAPLLSGVGAILLGAIAIDIARIRAEPKPIAASAVWALTLSNPFFYAWWPSVGASFLAATGVWGAAGFLLAIFGWVALFSFLMAHGASRWAWFAPVVSLLSADGLAAFALLLALRAASGL